MAAGGEGRWCAFVNATARPGAGNAGCRRGKIAAARCAGFNNVDLDAAKRCGITVLRVPGYSPEAWPNTPWRWPWPPTAASAKPTSRCAPITLRWTACWVHTHVRLRRWHRGHWAHRRGHGPHLLRLRHDCAWPMTSTATCTGGLVRYVGLEELLRTADPRQPALPADAGDPPHD